MSDKRRAMARNRESGFALLFIYAMAATVAIMLYMEIPRVAFEAQRDKEQLLIDRGEQYSRAVNLFVRKFNRYPADFDALQNTQNLRFLRRKYIDPMTGKDDWRIIHVGPGGVFTDSLVYGKKKDGKQQTEQQNFITEMQQIGGNQTGANQPGVNLALRQRESDQPGAPGDPNNLNNQNQPPQLDANGQPIPNNASGTPPTGVNGPVQVLPDGRIVPVFQPGTQPGANGQLPQGANGLPPGVQFPPGTMQIQGAPPSQFFPGGNQGQQGIPGQQQQPGTPVFPGQPNAPPGGAANLINTILTTPRPGGMNGLVAQPQPGAPNGNPQTGPGFGATPGPGNTTTGFGNNNTGTALAPMGGQTVGGGIAGVASKREQEGIKTYRERTSYNEWEFVYDITHDSSRGGGAQQPQGAQQSPTGAAAGSNTNPSQNPNPPPAMFNPAK